MSGVGTDIGDLSPNGRRLEARATMLNVWHRLLCVHDHLDLNDPESAAIAEITTALADKLQEIEEKRPQRGNLCPACGKQHAPDATLCPHCAADLSRP